MNTGGAFPSPAGPCPGGLIAITPEDSRGDDLERQVLRRLMEHGFFRFHLRRPAWDIHRARSFLTALGPNERAFVSLHDHHDLAAELGIGGVHHNRRNPFSNPGGGGRLAGMRSISIHHPKDWDGLHGKPGAFDYFFYSPVYPSLSKPGYSNDQAIRAFTEWGRPRQVGAFALGGVTADHLGELAAAGFSGAATIGAIWGSPGDSMETIEKRISALAMVSPFGPMSQ